MSWKKSSDSRSTYRIFVSHAWDYSDEYEAFIDLLEDKNYFDFENYSAPEDDPVDGASDWKIRLELKKQIEPVSVVIVLAGMYVNEGKWIEEEIEIAQDKDKPILGVEPWGSERTPSTVEENADKMVGWNTDPVVEAIRDLTP